MVSTFTPNIQLEEPARGDDTGTWDTPVNNNTTLIDLVVGNITTIGLNNSNVILNAGQFQSRQIIFNSTLTGSVTITFPTSFKKNYEIYHTCTGSSAFTITLATTVAGGQVVCAVPNETIFVTNDGTNIRYTGLDRIGSYWDYAGSSVPNWISGCTVPPYLNCDGTTFSSATYPQLVNVLGGTTLPNSKGRVRAALDQGAGLISTAATGFNTPNVGGIGGAQSNTLGSSNLPASIPITDPGHTHTISNNGTVNGEASVAASAFFTITNTGVTTNSAVTGITVNPGSANTAITNLQPSYIGGLMMIRAG